MEIKELQVKFEGRGEVRDYEFTQLEKTEKAYLYEVVCTETKNVHYEVFKRIINEQFQCVSYPKSPSFGIWAWCIRDKQKAIKKFDSIK